MEGDSKIGVVLVGAGLAVWRGVHEGELLLKTAPLCLF